MANDFLIPNLRPLPMPEPVVQDDWETLTREQRSATDRARYLKEYETYPRFAIPVPGAGDLVVHPLGELSGISNIPPEMLARPDIQAVIQAAQSRAQFPKVTKPLEDIKKIPTLQESALPAIQQLLGERSQFLLPQIEALRELTGQNVAAAQSDIGARGLRGSDIEQAALIGARGQGQAAESQLRGQFALESSKLLSDLIFRAMLGDKEAATSLQQLLAQAMGQQVSGERDILMAGTAQKNLMDEAEKKRKSDQTNAIIQGSLGAIGTIGGGLIAKSDRRLKTKIKTLKTVNGFRIVSFRWNDKGRALNMPESMNVGVIAQEIERKHPSIVGLDGEYKTVDYSKLPKEVRNEISWLGGI